MNPNTGRLARVLMVDDSAAEIFLAKEILKKERIYVHLVCVQSGEEALRYLNERRMDRDEDSMPDLIFLDLNMPDMDGKEMLCRFQSCHELRNIPVIIYSASEDPSDIKTTQRLGTRYYMIKTIDRTKLRRAVNSIKELTIEEEKETKDMYLRRKTVRE